MSETLNEKKITDPQDIWSKHDLKFEKPFNDIALATSSQIMTAVYRCRSRFITSSGTPTKRLQKSDVRTTALQPSRDIYSSPTER